MQKLLKIARVQKSRVSHFLLFGLLLFESRATILGHKWEMEIGRLLGYFSPVFGAVTSEKSGNPAERFAGIYYDTRRTVTNEVQKTTTK